MYAAVPRIMPTPVTPTGLVSVGECVIASGDDVGVTECRSSGGPSALARPKSSTFNVPSARTLTLAGFEIAMDDPLLVRGFERLGDLPRDRQRLVEWHATLSDAVGQRRALATS